MSCCKLTLWQSHCQWTQALFATNRLLARPTRHSIRSFRMVCPSVWQTVESSKRLRWVALLMGMVQAMGTGTFVTCLPHGGLYRSVITRHCYTC